MNAHVFSRRFASNKAELQAAIAAAELRDRSAEYDALRAEAEELRLAGLLADSPYDLDEFALFAAVNARVSGALAKARRWRAIRDRAHGERVSAMPASLPSSVALPLSIATGALPLAGVEAAVPAPGAAAIFSRGAAPR